MLASVGHYCCVTMLQPQRVPCRWLPIPYTIAIGINIRFSCGDTCYWSLPFRKEKCSFLDSKSSDALWRFSQGCEYHAQRVLVTITEKLVFFSSQRPQPLTTSCSEICRIDKGSAINSGSIRIDMWHRSLLVLVFIAVARILSEAGTMMSNGKPPANKELCTLHSAHYIHHTAYYVEHACKITINNFEMHQCSS